jgi:hypothetical protein
MRNAERRSMSQRVGLQKAAVDTLELAIGQIGADDKEPLLKQHRDVLISCRNKARGDAYRQGETARDLYMTAIREQAKIIKIRKGVKNESYANTELNAFNHEADKLLHRDEVSNAPSRAGYQKKKKKKKWRARAWQGRGAATAGLAGKSPRGKRRARAQ